MKKVFHLCHSSNEEVLFRSNDDYVWGFNCYALALYKTESNSLADAQMSNHRHLISQTDNPDKLMHLTRLAYTRHMNVKYHRRGPLGEQEHFCVELEGLHRIITAITYTLRNALHHGVSPTPFAYPHSSANLIFSSQLGKLNDAELMPKRGMHNSVGRNVKIPNGYLMGQSGLLLRENVTAVKQVELLYGTPRGFLFYMNRLSDEKWLDEQKDDKVDGPLITMELIEQGVSLTSAEDLRTYEKGRANYNQISDIQLCEEIDKIVVEKYKVPSVYCLPYSQKQELFCFVREVFRAGEAQARRCLAMDYI